MAERSESLRNWPWPPWDFRMPGFTDAQAELCQVISWYSEELWAAGWNLGVEKKVREIGGPFWCLLALRAGGWPDRYVEDEGLCWLPLTDEEKRVALAAIAAEREKAG